MCIYILLGIMKLSVIKMGIRKTNISGLQVLDLFVQTPTLYLCLGTLHASLILKYVYTHIHDSFYYTVYHT